MPRRDPHTGKFVSGDKPSNFDRRETLSGGIVVSIPAADNAGGDTYQTWTGDTGLVFDFDDVLHQDEIFYLEHLDYSGSLALPVTATAESAAVVGYAIGSDSTDPTWLAETTALEPLPRVTAEEGVIDVLQDQDDDDSMLMAGSLYAEASIADTVNALAAGADYENENRSFRPKQDLDRTYAFDSEDELVINGEMQTRNVSDHQVVYSAQVVMHGYVADFD